MTSNYWQQKASEMGHDARLVSAKLVSKIRENQKTDENDALAVVQAGQLVGVNYIKGKSFAQQELQSILRMHELAVEHKVAQGNQVDSQPFNKTLRRTRKRIETLYSQLRDQFMIRRNYAKSFEGFSTRILSKITALTMIQWINKLNGNHINNLKIVVA